MRINKINKNKVIKKTLILLSLIMSIITIYQIANVYAVFYSEATGTMKKDLAKWNIVVNGTDISSGITDTFVIDKFNVEGNINVIDGKIAPGMLGNFQICIEPKDTQVSVRYDILIDDSNISGSSITLTSVEETNTNNTIIRTGENTYTGLIHLSNITSSYQNNIKITFKWENDEINNEQDTKLGMIINSKIPIPISVKISQYLGEEIIAYSN